MSLPFRSELEEIKKSVENALKEADEKNDPQIAIKALDRAIERAKRKNRLEERMKFASQKLLVETRYGLELTPEDLIEAVEKYTESLKQRKDPKAEEYEEALSVLKALFKPDEVPENAPEKVKAFASAVKDYEKFLKQKHEFLDYAKAVIMKTKFSEIAPSVIEKRLDEIEEELKPIVEKRTIRRATYTFEAFGRVIVIRVREDFSEIPDDLRRKLKSLGIDFGVV